jgi:phosphatidylinositol glycan class V
VLGLELSGAGFALGCYILSLVFNVACFGAAAVLLRTLTRETASGWNRGRGTGGLFVSRVMFVFIFAPAGVFTVATYSESLFTALVMGAAVLFRRRRWLLGSLVGMAAAATRSNGTLLVIPIILGHLWQKEKGHRTANESHDHRRTSHRLSWLLPSVRAAACCLLILAPFLTVNFISCYAHPGIVSDCSGVGFLSFYHTIQETFWNVGLFRYYTLRKLPNFVVGLPLPVFLLVSVYRQRLPLTRVLREPFTVTLAVSSGLCCLALHVETTNRLLLANPAVYWHLAHLLDRRTPYRIRYALVWFLCAWTVIGGAMFAKHLPWT